MNSNSTQSAIRFAFGAVSLGILAACGGEAGGGLDVADGGIRGTGSSVGPVSGFGSVFVNGIRFDTDGLNGRVESDDGISEESELDKGMILRVDGTWHDDGQGVASRVEYDDTLRGEIAVIQPWDPGTRTATLSIYGLIVHIDSQTVVRGKKAIELSSGDFVRVSAWRLPNGEFRASSVRALTNSAVGALDPEKVIELEGQVSQFNQDLQTFQLANMSVKYDPDSTEFRGVEISDLENNAFVEVEGRFNGNVLLAIEIDEDDLRRYRRGEDEDIEFAGPVSTAIDPATRIFEINGLFVRVTDDTDFDDGLAENDLAPNLLIQVEGEFLDDGTVEAEEIELREGESEVEGGVSVNEVFPDTQTFRIGGVLVQVMPQTIIIGEDDVRKNFDSLGRLHLQEVKVNGIERGSAEAEASLEAIKVEIDNDIAGNELKLVGRLRSIQGNIFTVLGVGIEINTSTEFDENITRDALQAMFDRGLRPLIEVDYRRTTSGFVAEKIELED